jgi:hypothetical protein
MGIQNAHQKSAGAKYHWRDQLNAQQLNSQRLLFGAISRDKDIANELRRKDPRQRADGDQDQQNQVENRRGKLPGLFRLFRLEESGKGRYESGSQRPSRHQVKHDLR